jgi:hypothetical protein
MTVMVPVNLRTTKPKKPSDVRLQNNFTLVLVNFMIGDTLEDVSAFKSWFIGSEEIFKINERS